MNSFKRYLSKKSLNQSWLKTLLDSVSKANWDQYFAKLRKEEAQSLSPVLLEESFTPYKAKRKKENEVTQKLVSSFQYRIETSEQRIYPPYVKEFTALRIDDLEPAFLFSSSSYSPYYGLIYSYDEIRAEISRTYLEQLQTFLIRALEAINRHLYHEIKEACNQFVFNRRSTFRNLGRFHIKKLDDTDSSVINTLSYQCINLTQNSHESILYKWAS